VSNRRLGQSWVSVVWVSLILSACSSGQTGDAGLGAGAVGTNQNDDGDDTQGPPDTTPTNTPDAGGDDQSNPPAPTSSVPNPSGDCVPEDNGGRDGFHSPDASDAYLPDCASNLQREYYRVFQQQSGTAYMIPRPDGHSAWQGPCRDEADPLHDLVNEYKLCDSAGSPDAVEAINAMQPADALTLAHALHEQLVFFTTENGVSPYPFSADIVAACKSNDELSSGVFGPRCETEIDLEGKPRPEEVITYSAEEATALAAALNTLYGIVDDNLCTRLTSSAYATLQASIEVSRACESDAQCASIGHNSTCHDACGDVISESQRATVDATRSQLDANQCAAFDSAGCTLIVPPCVPPGTAACVEDQCVIQ
jgi:hypothetical protein